MSKYLAYPVYKESGVEWLGEVPEHWEVKKLKYISFLRGGAGFPHDEQNVKGEELVFYKVNALAKTDKNDFLILENENTVSELTAKKLGAFVFPVNSIVFAKVGAALLLGRIRLLAQNACIDNNMMGLIVDSNNSFVFIKYLMSLIKFDLLVNPGAIPSVNEGQISNILLSFPPLEEQQQIAAFLDNKTAHLDTLIEKKQQMIGLLNEKRISLITQAVTKGLDLSVPMKDSGIEWLGNVPKHWDIWKLKFSVDLMTNKTNAKESELQFIGLENIESFTGKILNSDSEIESEGVALYYQDNDVLFCKLRPYLAKVYLANQDGLCTSELLVLRGIKVIPTFLKYYLLSQDFINIVNSSTYGSKMPRANWEFIGNLPCLIPFEKEQQQIADYLDRETAKLDRMINTIQSAIAKLQEYRSALITAAVTGKIDVRTLTHE